MPFVVVDMGSDAAPDRMEWVLEACTRALTRGRCVADAPSDDDEPRAVAIVRVRDAEGRLVRIEVGRRRDERALWSVRELEFAPQDPAAERWRAVGLALATLVGEIEQPAPEASTPPEQALPDAAAAEPVPPPEIAADAERAAPRGIDAERSDSLRTEPDEAPSEPLPRPRAFVGLGALGGLGDDSLRWGGGLKAGWLFESGIELALAGDYSRAAVQPELDLDWLRFTSAVGYRHFVSDRWSLGLAVRAGVRGLGTEVDDAGVTRRDRTWSPFGAASAGLWWQPLRAGGAWLELEMGSIGRTTRLLGRNRALASELPLGEPAGWLGVWLAL